MQTNDLSFPSSQSSIEEDNIFTYLLTLPTETLNQLYNHSFTCKSLFRYLLPLARQFILQIVFSVGPVPMKRLVANTKQKTSATGINPVEDVLKILIRFGIISVKSAGQQSFVTLNPIFQKTFINCLTHDTSNVQVTGGATTGDQSVGGSSEVTKTIKPDKKPPSVSDIESFARIQWESVLQFMNSSSSASEHNVQFSVGIQQLLEWSHLVRGKDDANSNMSSGYDESSTKSRITKEGFQFLLLDTKTQVWKLLRQYIDTSEKRQMSKIEILQFMFELSFMQCGKGYPVKQLTKTQRVMLLDLAELGLIFRRKTKSKWFYPTQLSIGLTNVHTGFSPTLDHTPADGNRGSAVDGVSSMGGHIIVETNFRVYAYTSSPLQISLLCLFVVPEYRLPNLVVGMITRESVREALIHGITADQILSYLTIHAHPHMKRTKPILPEVVADQVRLWEKERNRFQLFNAVHYDKFPSLDKFRIVEEYAKRIGVHLWSSDVKMKLIVQRDGHEKMVAFIKQNV